MNQMHRNAFHVSSRHFAMVFCFGVLVSIGQGQEITNFTGADSAFEEPESPDLRIETEGCTETESLETLYRFVRPRLLPT